MKALLGVAVWIGVDALFGSWIITHVTMPALHAVAAAWQAAP
jgi:hypothetical protein